MEVNQKVLVYTDEIVGWEVGRLVERYSVIENRILEKWSIETTTGSAIVRYVKKSKELKKDGCGYLLKGEMETIAKIICRLAKEDLGTVEVDLFSKA